MKRSLLSLAVLAACNAVPRQRFVALHSSPTTEPSLEHLRELGYSDDAIQAAIRERIVRSMAELQLAARSGPGPGFWAGVDPATEPPTVAVATAPRLCREDNWNGDVLEPEPYSVRWANRKIQSRFDWDWSKWHYTEGNGSFTACGRPVLIGSTDGPMFPETFPTLEKVNCRACLAKMAAAGVTR